MLRTIDIVLVTQDADAHVGAGDGGELDSAGETLVTLGVVVLETDLEPLVAVSNMFSMMAASLRGGGCWLTRQSPRSYASWSHCCTRGVQRRADAHRLRQGQFNCHFIVDVDWVGVDGAYRRRSWTFCRLPVDISSIGVVFASVVYEEKAENSRSKVILRIPGIFVGGFGGVALAPIR